MGPEAQWGGAGLDLAFRGWGGFDSSASCLGQPGKGASVVWKQSPGGRRCLHSADLTSKGFILLLLQRAAGPQVLHHQLGASCRCWLLC